VEQQAITIYCTRCGKSHQIASRGGCLKGLKRIKCKCGYWQQTGRYRTYRGLDGKAIERPRPRKRRAEDEEEVC
jgi:hypothetical protein